jgi:hypothetical protein
MESKEAVAALGALAHETRLAVFRLPIRAGPEGVAAFDQPAATCCYARRQVLLTDGPRRDRMTMNGLIL